MKVFGKFLSNLRNSAKISLEELALLAGSSKSTLSRLENNEVPQPFRGSARNLIIALAEILCTSPKETERYLALAEIERSLLTEAEEIQLGFAPFITFHDPNNLERLERIYSQRLLAIEERGKQVSSLPVSLERKVQQYSNTLDEIRQQLDKPNNGNEASKPEIIQAVRAHDSAELPGDKILVLNFTHPLSEQQREQIEELAGTPIDEVLTIPMQIDETEPLSPQITRLVDAIGLSFEDWDKRHILINPPGYAPAAFLLLAEIHGRMGHFPTFVRFRPKHGSVTSYEALEILNLQTIRDAARMSNTAVIKTGN
jgi:transcriptional regulator with XRE-family HTH domain